MSFRRRRRLVLVGAEDVLHRMGAEGGEVFLLVGEEEFVAVGAADDGGFLAENFRFKDVRRVFSHPVADEFLRLSVQEFEGFSYNGPPEAARRKIGGAAAATAAEEYESESDESTGNKKRENFHGCRRVNFIEVLSRYIMKISCLS